MFRGVQDAWPAVTGNTLESRGRFFLGCSSCEIFPCWISMYLPYSRHPLPMRMHKQKEARWRNPSKHTYTFSSSALTFGGKKKAFIMTNRKNSSFKRTLSQQLNIYTLDAITFWNMVKFTVSSMHETLLPLHGCKKYKKSLDQGKRKLERNFEKCATNLVKMNYRVAFVFSYERFKNALFCINSIGPSTRMRSIFNFPIFRIFLNIEYWILLFENGLPKGFFGKKKIRIFWSDAGFSIVTDNGS